MHVVRSLLIILALCVIFFVLLRPKLPSTEPFRSPDGAGVVVSDSAAVDTLYQGRP